MFKYLMGISFPRYRSKMAKTPIWDKSIPHYSKIDHLLHSLCCVRARTDEYSPVKLRGEALYSTHTGIFVGSR